MMTPTLIIIVVALSIPATRTASQDATPCDRSGGMDVTGQSLTRVPVPDPESCDEAGPPRLILAGNNLQTLPTGSFENFRRLNSLDLSSNEIAKIEPRAFSGTHALEELVIDNNPLRVLVGQPFETLQLGTLSIREAGLVWIEAEVFADGFQGLRRLGLASNNLTILPEGVFDNMPHLAFLGLSFNRLKELDPRLFARLGNVAVIDLSGNALSSIPEGLFEGLARLRRLDLSQNPLAPRPVVLRFSAAPTISLVNCSMTSLPLLTSDLTDAEGDAIMMVVRGNLVECDCSYVDESVPIRQKFEITCDDGRGAETLLCLPADADTTKHPMITDKVRKPEPRPTPADRQLCPTCVTVDCTNPVHVGVTTVLFVLVVGLIIAIVFMYFSGKPRYQKTTRVEWIT